MSSQNKKIVYHYTTHDAATKIISQSQLWLTNIRFLNDSKEWLWVFEHAKEALDKKISRETPIDPVIAEDAKWKLETERNISVCVSCFSYHDDDAAQWDRYSNRGQGVAIGFYEDVLRQAAEEQRGVVGKVEYSEDLLNKEIEKAFNLLEKEVAETGRCSLRSTNDPISMLSPFFKHKTFISESEFRIIQYGVGFHQYKFFSRADTIVPYVPLSYPTGAIAEICIGPRSATESISAWNLLLTQTGIGNIQIKKSCSTLR